MPAADDAAGRSALAAAKKRADDAERAKVVSAQALDQIVRQHKKWTARGDQDKIKEYTDKKKPALELHEKNKIASAEAKAVYNTMKQQLHASAMAERKDALDRANRIRELGKISRTAPA
jgi:hypothetical protein